MPKVKGMPRKSQSYGTVKYISNDCKHEYGTHNLIGYTVRDISKEFDEHESGSGQRTFYHEVISFHPKDKEKCTQKLMKEFSEKYIEKVYPNQRVYWGVHREKEHVHVHMCISATNMNGKKLQISNQDMGNRDRFVQNYAKNKGLHAMDDLVLSFQKGNQKIKSMSKERSQASKKDYLKDKITDAIKTSKTANEFERNLNKDGIAISDRKTGVRYDNRNYRFKTLGVLEEIERFKKDLEKDSKVAFKLNKIKDYNKGDNFNKYKNLERGKDD